MIWEETQGIYYIKRIASKIYYTRMKMLQVVPLLVLVISATVLSERDCPPWFKWVNTSYSSGYCACASEEIRPIKCDQIHQKSYLRLATCVFYDSDTDEIAAGRCPFIFPNSNKLAFLLPNNVNDLNKFVCGNFSREVKGPLCGKCTGNTGPSVYSVGSECVPCSHINILYYLLLQYLPITLIFLVILLLKLNVTAAPMAHYVLFCNLIAFYCRFALSFYSEIYGTDNIYILGLVKLVVSLSAVWSFDALFFIAPPLCISSHLEEIYMPLIEFVAILYPFILLLLTHIVIQLHFYNFKPIVTLWGAFYRLVKKFHRHWEPNASLIQAFSSIFFLSYAKFNFVIFQTLLHTTLKTEDGKFTTKRLVYFDPSILYLSEKHISMIMFSIFVSIFLYFPPNLLLILYPTSLYRKISSRIRPRWRIGIKTFVETYQGCYKDSTNGTRDYRAVSGCAFALPGFVLIMLQFVTIAVLSDEDIIDNYFPQYFTLIYVVVLIILCSLLQPYKQKIANVSAITILAILGTIFTLTTGLQSQYQTDLIRIMIIILLFLPHCGLGVYLLWKMNIFGVCHNKYINLRRNERNEIREIAVIEPLNLVDSTMN